MALVVKNLPANAGDVRDAGSIPGSGRFPGGGYGNTFPRILLLFFFSIKRVIFKPQDVSELLVHFQSSGKSCRYGQGFSNSLDKRFNQKFYRTLVKILRKQVEKIALENYQPG